MPAIHTCRWYVKSRFKIFFCCDAVILQAFYFDRDDLALSGLHKFFKKASDEEREHAMKFMKYQNKRGGKIALSDIKTPKNEWGTAQDAMQAALDLEVEVNEVCVAYFI